jgi:hypothetical protein
LITIIVSFHFSRKKKLQTIIIRKKRCVNRDYRHFAQTQFLRQSQRIITKRLSQIWQYGGSSKAPRTQEDFLYSQKGSPWNHRGSHGAIDHPGAVEAHTGTKEAHPWRHGGSPPQAMVARPGAMEAHLGSWRLALEPWLVCSPGDVDANSGTMETHPGAMETYPGAVEGAHHS